MSEYKIGDRVIHHGHITEVVGVSVKYMLCGGAVVYAHDLKPATAKSHEKKTCATHSTGSSDMEA